MTSARGYLDTASAEPLHPAARETLAAALERGYADPRRLHRAGRESRLLLDNARAVVAECLGVHADEVGFTASGTDAVHRGLLGLVRARSRDGIVHSAVEHSSVLHAVRWLGAEHAEIPVDATGRVDLAAMADAAREPGAAAVALQAANQEVGTLQPVDDLDLPDDVPLFVDAAAAVGRVPLPRRWTALAASAHKWGGPAGLGVLAVRRSARWTTPFPGDDGLDHLGGEAAVPLALAAAAALQSVQAEQDETRTRHLRQTARIRDCVASLPDVEVVGHPVDRLPHLVTASVLYAGGDEMVAGLDRRGFGVASGSACTASTLEPSHVLAAMGALTHGNIRISLRRDTTDDEVEGLCDAVAEVVAAIRDGIGLTTPRDPG